MNKKKIGKYLILGTFVIITGIVGVSAANTLTSNGVLYSNAVSNVTTVEGALNELYANYNSLLAKGDASASDILVGKKALVKGKEVTGTMADRGVAQYGSWGCGNAGCGSGTDAYYAINSLPEGYYHSSGISWAPEARINANTLRDQLGVSASKILSGQSIAGVSGTATSDATASAGNILSGKTAYVNGSKVTGTMTNWAGTPQHIDAVRLANGRFEVAVARGYHDYYWDGNSYEYLTYSQVANTIGLTSDKIVSGQSVLGINGTGETGYKVYNFNGSQATIKTSYKSFNYGTWTKLSYDKTTECGSYACAGEYADSIFIINTGIDSSKIVGGEITISGNYSSSSSTSWDPNFRLSGTEGRYLQNITVGFKNALSISSSGSNSSNDFKASFYKEGTNIGIRFSSTFGGSGVGTATTIFETRADTFYLSGYIVYK